MTDAEILLQNNTSVGITWIFILTVFATVIGSGFSMGFSISVFNQPSVYIKRFINSSYIDEYGHELSDHLLIDYWSLINLLYCFGGLSGCFLGGQLCALIGRRDSLILNNALIAIGGFLMMSSKFVDIWQFILIGRFLNGVFCGYLTVVSPVYLAEISPAKIRGGVVSLFQLSIVLGLFLAEVVGFNWILGSEKNWPWLNVISLILAFIQPIILPFCPKSPTYLLVIEKDRSAAIDALQRLRGDNYDISGEIPTATSKVDYDLNIDPGNMDEDYIPSSVAPPTLPEEPKPSLRTFISERATRRAFLCAFVLMAAQQLTGINAVNYYSTSIFIDSGVSHGNAIYYTVLTSLFQVILTFFVIPCVDRFGRKVLQLSGMLFMGFVAYTLAFSFYTHLHILSVFSVVLFVSAFSMGPGAVPWLVSAELFSDASRSVGMSMAASLNWIFNGLVGLTTPILISNLHPPFVFAMFASFNLIFAVFIAILVPETKNKTTDQIQLILQSQ